MSCSGAFATPQQYADLFLCRTLGSGESDALQPMLDNGAANIHAVLASVGACDCTLASWATQYLIKLNIIEAAILPPTVRTLPSLTEEQRKFYQEMLETEYERILSGKIDVCQGATGIDYPAADFIQQSLTPWNTRQIVVNRMLKGW